MQLSTSAILDHTFPLARRGYEPGAVDTFLADIAAAVGELQAELTQAHEAEEAVKLTFMAAAQAKQDLIDEARRTADDMLEEARAETAVARQEAQRVRHKAQQAAEELTVAAREEALEMLAATRADAEALAEQMRVDHQAAAARVDAAHAAVERARQQLVALARDAGEGLAEADRVLAAERSTLADAPPPEPVAIEEIVVTPEAPDVEEVEEPVLEPAMARAPQAAASESLPPHETPGSAHPEPASLAEGTASLVLPEAGPSAPTAAPPKAEPASRGDTDRQGELLAALQSLTLG